MAMAEFMSDSVNKRLLDSLGKTEDEVTQEFFTWKERAVPFAGFAPGGGRISYGEVLWDVEEVFAAQE